MERDTCSLMCQMLAAFSMLRQGGLSPRSLYYHFSLRPQQTPRLDRAPWRRQERGCPRARFEQLLFRAWGEDWLLKPPDKPGPPREMLRALGAEGVARRGPPTVVGGALVLSTIALKLLTVILSILSSFLSPPLFGSVLARWAERSGARPESRACQEAMDLRFGAVLAPDATT